ncbi:hypothetical protein IC582_005366 [Cucumis melo]
MSLLCFIVYLWYVITLLDEIRTEWAAFVSRFVSWMILFVVILCRRVERCADILVGLIVLNIVFYMEVYAGILGIIVCIADELGIILCIAGI